MYLYLGPWSVDSGESSRLGVTVWAPPEGCFSGIDLRYPGNDLKNAGVFTSYVKLENKEIVYLGEGDWGRIRLNKKIKDAFFSLSGIRVTRNSLLGAIYEIFTDRADILGSSGPKPIVPHRNGKAKLSHGVKNYEKEFDVRQSRKNLNKLYALHRRDIQKLWEQGEYDDARQYVSLLLNKYGLNKSQWRLLVPRRIQKEFRGPIPPKTLYQDNFNSSTLNSNWNVFQGTLVATGTRVAPDTSGSTSGYNSAYWNQALHIDDHYSQIEIYQQNAGAYGGPIARQSNTAGVPHCYYAEKLVGGANKLFKWLSGSATLLQNVSGTFTDGAPVKVNCNGSTIEHYYNGSLLGSVTDTSITGNLYAGFMLYASYNGKTFDYMEGDNWEARDPVFDVSATITSNLSVSPSATITSNNQVNITNNLSLTATSEGPNNVDTTLSLTPSISASNTIDVSVDLTIGANVSDSYQANLSTTDETTITNQLSLTAEDGSHNSVESTIQASPDVTANANLDMNAQASVDANISLQAVGGIVHNLSSTIVVQPSIKSRASKIHNVASSFDITADTGPIGSSYTVSETEIANITLTGVSGKNVEGNVTVSLSPSLTAETKGDIFLVESTITVNPIICSRQFHLGNYTKQSSFSVGDNYPFIHPDQELKRIFVDFWIYLASGNKVEPPLKLSYIYGFGPQPGTIGREVSGCFDLGIVDGNGNTVFDTRNSVLQFVNSWGPQLSVARWEDPQQGILCVVFHTAWDKTEGYPSLPIYFEPTNGVLDPRTYIVDPNKITSLAVEGQTITPTFQIEPGYNYEIELSKEDGIRPKAIINMNVDAGAGAGKYPVDCDSEIDRTISTINNVVPDEQGNFTINADPCFNLIPEDTLRNVDVIDELRITSGKLELQMDCSSCSDCQDYINVWEAARKIRDKIDNLNQKQLSVRDTYEKLVQRFEDNRKCREEKKLFGQIIPICPDRAVIVAGYCNTEDRCLRRVALAISLQYEDGTGKCPQLKTNNEFTPDEIEVSCGKMIQSITTDESPSKPPEEVSNPPPSLYTPGGGKVEGQLRPLPIKYVDGKREEIEPVKWVIWESVDIGKSAYAAFGIQFNPEKLPRKVEMVVEAFEIGDTQVKGDNQAPVPGYVPGKGPVNTPDEMKLTECGIKVGTEIPERCCEEETDISNSLLEPLFE